jgi:hypothetical protein
MGYVITVTGHTSNRLGGAPEALILVGSCVFGGGDLWQKKGVRGQSRSLCSQSANVAATSVAERFGTNGTQKPVRFEKERRTHRGHIASTQSVDKADRLKFKSRPEGEPKALYFHLL